MSRRPVIFYFDDRPMEGIRGEPIAKALFKAGVRTLSYSVKYKRPRGIHCARGRCVMCHMSVNGVPGVPTCITPLEEGMRVERENYRPFFAPLLTTAARLFSFKAGFYYRMFNRPRWLRTFFVQSLRKMAGVGRIRIDPPTAPRGNPKRWPLRDRYDIVVVGAGVSGMSAALSAADSALAITDADQPAPVSGRSVLLVDEYGAPGGHSIGFQPEALRAERDRMIDAVAQHRSIHFQPNATAVAFYPPDTLLLGPGGCTGFAPYTGRDTAAPQTNNDAGGGMKRVRGRAFVFATGAYDVTPLFKNNDTPGIFGPRAIRLLLERNGLKPGTRAAVYGTGDTLLQTAELLAHHGIDLSCLVDPADVQLLPEIAGVPVTRGGKVTAAKGKEWITGVTVAGSVTRRGRGAMGETFRCDMLCTAFGGQGAYELPYQAGFNYALSDAVLDEERVLVPQQSRFDGAGGVRFVVTGEAAGSTDPAAKIAGGADAGRHAAAVWDS